MALTPPYQIGILGLGRFGAAFAELTRTHGFPTLTFDPKHPEASPSTFAEVVARADVLIVAVPIENLDAVLSACAPLLRPDQLVIDVCSVKVEPEARMRERLGNRSRWIASHPLFGPVSLSRGEPRTVVLCPRVDQPETTNDAASFFRALGCELIEVPAEEHDRVMSRTHVLAFFVARALQDIGAASAPFAPPSFKSMAHVVSLVREDAGHLFTAIQTGNPFAKEARRELIAALQKIDAELD